jgi:cardiolipin synthase A/B
LPFTQWEGCIAVKRTAQRLPKQDGRGIVLLALLVLLAGCGPIGQDELPTDLAGCLAQVPAPVSETRGLLVQPDDGRAPILDEFAAARCSIDLTIYLISDDDVIAGLKEAVARDVQVRVILEEHPFGGGGGQDERAAELQAAGMELHWSSNRFRFTHAKYAVVDRQTALILNQNLTTSSFEGNREFGVVTTVGDDVDEAQTIFDADWEGRPVRGPFDLVVSPDNSRAELGEIIGEATSSLDLYAEVVRDPAMMTALTEAEQRGVAVRLLLTDENDEANLEVAARLARGGVEIRLVDRLYIHAKLVLADGDRVFVGSQNFTATSLDANRELGLVIAEPVVVDRAEAIFARDWIQAIPGDVVEQ